MSKVIHIVNHLPSTVTTRKAIRLINDSVSFSDNENVVFDFKGIDFISRAFADEFIHFVHKHKIKARFYQYQSKHTGNVTSSGKKPKWKK